MPSLVPIQIADFDRASGMNAFLFAGAPDQQFWLQSSTNLETWASVTGEASWFPATNRMEFFRVSRLLMERVMVP